MACDSNTNAKNVIIFFSLWTVQSPKAKTEHTVFYRSETYVCVYTHTHLWSGDRGNTNSCVQSPPGVTEDKKGGRNRATNSTNNKGRSQAELGISVIKSPLVTKEQQPAVTSPRPSSQQQFYQNGGGHRTCVSLPGLQ